MQDVPSNKNYIKIWRIDDSNIARELPLVIPQEEKIIHDILEKNPFVIGENMVLLKREFDTGYGIADLVFLTSEASLVIVEVKREASRDAVAQLLGYGCWASRLTIKELKEIVRKITGLSLYDFIKKNFYKEDEDIELNIELNDNALVNYTLLLIAPVVDYKTRAIISYLKDYGIPIDALVLHYFRYSDESNEKFLARIYYTRETELSFKKNVIDKKKFIEIMANINKRELAENIVKVFEEFIKKYGDRGAEFIERPKMFGLRACNGVEIVFQVTGGDQGYHGVWITSNDMKIRRKVYELARSMNLEQYGFRIKEPNEKSKIKIIAFGRQGSRKTLKDSIEELEKFAKILQPFLNRLAEICYHNDDTN